MRRLWRDNSLIIVLFTLWLITFTMHGWAVWVEEHNTASAHGAPFTIDGWLEVWIFELFNGWQGDFAQMLIAVWAMKHFISRGSAESRDGEDEILKRVKHIEERLNR